MAFNIKDAPGIVAGAGVGLAGRLIPGFNHAGELGNTKIDERLVTVVDPNTGQPIGQQIAYRNGEFRGLSYGVAGGGFNGMSFTAPFGVSKFEIAGRRSVGIGGQVAGGLFFSEVDATQMAIFQGQQVPVVRESIGFSGAIVNGALMALNGKSVKVTDANGNKQMVPAGGVSIESPFLKLQLLTPQDRQFFGFVASALVGNGEIRSETVGPLTQRTSTFSGLATAAAGGYGVSAGGGEFMSGASWGWERT